MKLDGIGLIITLSSYSPYEEGTAQHAFFIRTVQGVDREQHPWLIVTFHTPFYLTFKARLRAMQG